MYAKISAIDMFVEEAIGVGKLYYRFTRIQIIISSSSDDLFKLLRRIDEESPAVIEWKIRNTSDAVDQCARQKVSDIAAAGGIVQDEHSFLLCIYRKKTWDLPKGKIENGEESARAAIREVMEETGIKNTSISREDFFPTYHLYKEASAWMLKKTYWYRMSASSGEPLCPQREEGIEKALWSSMEEWKERLSTHTYPLVKDIISESIAW